MRISDWSSDVCSSDLEIAFFSGLAFALAYALSRPYIAARVRLLANRRYDINSLFNLPLIAGAALLSFAHGANDVANAVGPLAAIVSTVQHQSAIADEVAIPLWVMAVGAVGISLRSEEHTSELQSLMRISYA